jgi:hypothetical protein
MDVKLNFIDHSTGTTDSHVVIFARDASAAAGSPAVAWKVIHSRPGETHHFIFPLHCEVEVEYGAGQHTRRQQAEAGQRFTFTEVDGRPHLLESGAAATRKVVEIVNGLSQGAIDANVYRGGRLFATRRGIAPKHDAVFSIEPTLRVGAVQHVHEGSIMNLAVLTSVNTELSLLGIASADIVMTGGGPGRSSMPFQFNLQKLVFP